MDAAALELVEPKPKGIEGVQSANKDNNDQTSSNNNKKGLSLPKLKHYKWWIRMTFYILCLLVGQTIATLLGRLYFDKGGNSKWLSSVVPLAGFPIYIPLLFFFPKPINSPPNPPLVTLLLIYLTLGTIMTLDSLMYSYGLIYLPVSTYSLLSATQLAFNCVTSYFINSQKFTMLVINSVFLLIISACLLSVNNHDEKTTTNNVVVSTTKTIIGFTCTLGASALYALMLSLVQLAFNKVIKSETLNAMFNLQIGMSFVGTCGCVMGLFASGEWSSLKGEMRDYKKGSLSYIMTLAGIALTWQVSTLGTMWLIIEVSALFSNVIATLGLPLVPVFAVVFFHDKMNGVKVIALILAAWGFVSYIYQHYLDDTKATAKAAVEENNNIRNEVHESNVEICVKDA